MKKTSKINILNDYISFLYVNDEVDEEERDLYNTLGHKFINCIETTSMSKSYKIPILLAFYNDGNIKLRVSADDIYKSFREFYSIPSNAVDMLKDKSTANFIDWGKDEYIKLSRRNPEYYLAQTHSDFFYHKDEYFCLNDNLKHFMSNNAFIRHFKDVVEYRKIRYYKERIKR
ncbi:hypothetical protein [Thermobrachium celere]|uniref:hypothetical protein n=1 Tax=Thermobrachium celere TaxID=53422 RepID=UPI001A4D8984|nr:hypothetical protein [Thermobrachium celere]GFR36426.1 hypothetical protein TCEA9_22380 [Thermobrachium celere]